MTFCTKVSTFSIETLGTLMGGLVWFEKTVKACQGPTSFIAYERGLVIFEYSHVFRSGIIGAISMLTFCVLGQLGDSRLNTMPNVSSR
jgi:hypothetical protein